MNGPLCNFMAILMTALAPLTLTAGISEAKTLRVHHPQVTLVLDPHRMEDAFSMAVVLQLFRGLMRYTPQGEVQPDLASSWRRRAILPELKIRLDKY